MEQLQNTVQLGSNIGAGSGAFNILNNATVDFGTYVLSGTNSFSLQSGASLVTANTNGIYATTASGSVQSTGTRIFDPGANYTYNGASAQNYRAGLTSANNLTINNGNGITITSGIVVNNILSLESGIISLGANNITITMQPFLQYQAIQKPIILKQIQQVN